MAASDINGRSDYCIGAKAVDKHTNGAYIGQSIGGSRFVKMYVIDTCIMYTAFGLCDYGVNRFNIGFDFIADF